MQLVQKQPSSDGQVNIADETTYDEVQVDGTSIEVKKQSDRQPTKPTTKLQRKWQRLRHLIRLLRSSFAVIGGTRRDRLRIRRRRAAHRRSSALPLAQMEHSTCVSRCDLQMSKNYPTLVSFFYFTKQVIYN
jgi:hypothetical protein